MRDGRQLTFIPLTEGARRKGADGAPTIYALSSGGLPAGVAVVRVSGARARDALASLVGGVLPQPRRATYVRLRHPKTGTTLDRGMAVWFPGPASVTGEDVAELHLHGGIAVVAAVTDVLSGMEDVRLAEAGEFTRRSFENGKLDLTEAEAIADLIGAETEQQRIQALRQMSGALHALYEGWRARLLNACANAEAAIDFSDEADIAADVAMRARTDAIALEGEIARHLDDDGAGERLRDGVHVAILGAPNAGKSSLLNALAKRDAAIVSETAGTTRDVIEVHLDLGGFPMTVADTAGLRATEDAVEREGVARALKRAENADVKICVFDANMWPALDPETERLIDANAVFVINKCDLRHFSDADRTRAKTRNREPIFVSAKTGFGLDRLVAALAAEAERRCRVGAAPVLTRRRHRDALEAARASLKRASGETLAEELMAEELRRAADALGRITGRIGVDDVLDAIFRDFCIGK